MDRIGKLSALERQEKVDEVKAIMAGASMELNKWYKAIDICSNVNITSREWRTVVEDIMWLYTYGAMPYMVVGSRLGYKATCDVSDIETFLRKKHSQFISLANGYYKLKKEMETRLNISFKFEGEEYGK